MNDPLLHIKNLTVNSRMDGSAILRGISMDIRKGRVTGIVGESGSCKSVTALSVMKLLPAGLEITDGNITIGLDERRINITRINEAAMRNLRGRHIAMIFQEPMTSLNPSMRCGNQIDEVLKRHTTLSRPEREEKIISLFRQVKIPREKDTYRAYPHQLSGGQRQRIMIAMALATEPELLIADEPTTALDVTIQKKIVDLIRELQEKTGITVLFISHDLRLIGEIAADIIVMRDGRIVESNSRQELLVNPVQPYTKGLLACQPPIDSRPERLPTVEDFERNTGNMVYQTGKTIPDQPAAKTESRGEILLSVQNLGVHYQRSPGIFGSSGEIIRAVDDVSLNVFKGETLGLVGESGCGKTTLGMTILRLIRHQHGDILYHGKRIDAMSRKEMKIFRQKVQVVFQDPYSSLNPKMTIGNMITEVMKVHFPSLDRKERLRRTHELLMKTGLPPEAAGKYPHEFSGGQRQRIGIARALATSPEFLILDESVSALDVSVQAMILNLLKDLKRDFGLSYIFISHDLAVVKYMSDRIVVMREGHIEEEGDAETIYKNPVSAYTRNLIRSVPGSNG